MLLNTKISESNFHVALEPGWPMCSQSNTLLYIDAGIKGLDLLLWKHPLRYGAGHAGQLAALDLEGRRLSEFSNFAARSLFLGEPLEVQATAGDRDNKVRGSRFGARGGRLRQSGTHDVVKASDVPDVCGELARKGKLSANSR